MEKIGGYCGKCGAPFYVPDMWRGVVAPVPRAICNCWNIDKNPECLGEFKRKVEEAQRLGLFNYERTDVKYGFPMVEMAPTTGGTEGVK